MKPYNAATWLRLITKLVEVGNNNKLREQEIYLEFQMIIVLEYVGI